MQLRAKVLLIFVVTVNFVLAQSTDTTFSENGSYCVFRTRFGGEVINPVAYYDSTGLFIYTACWRDHRLHGPVINYDREGRKTKLMEYKAGLPDGSEVYYYPNGNVQLVQTFRSGKPHGTSTSYHPNGLVEWERTYRKGKMHGERTLRDTTGAFFNGEYTTHFPMGKGQFTNNFINGRPHGNFTVLGPIGQVRYTGNYTMGVPDGEFVYFDNSDNIISRDYYKKGKFVESDPDE